MTYLIWSIEHNMWWRPFSQGYTSVLADAGRYPETEAYRILQRANRITINECRIPVECVEEQPSIICPKCSYKSYNPNDIREKYCGNCNQFHPEMTK